MAFPNPERADARRNVAGRLLCLTVLAATATPLAAAGQTVSSATLVSDFRTMCMATNASREGALAEAEKRRWVQFPTKGFAQGNETFIEARRSGDRFLLVSENPGDLLGADGKQRIRVRYKVCRVFARVDDPKAVITFAEGVVGPIKPYSADTFAREWFYSRTDAGPRPLITNGDAVEAARAGRFRQLMVSDEQTPARAKNTALSYTVVVTP